MTERFVEFARRYALACLPLLAGCGASPPAIPTVNEELASRVLKASTTNSDDAVPLAEYVHLDDGLTLEEAIVTALLENPTFGAELLTVRVSEAGWIEAGQIANPFIQLLFPTGPTKIFEAWIGSTLDSLWTRDERRRLAELDIEAQTARLVQAGMTLTRTVSEIYRDWVEALGILERTREAETLASELAALDTVRLETGDVSLFAAETTRADAQRAREDTLVAERNATLAARRLRGILGLGYGDAGEEPLEVALSRFEGSVSDEGTLVDRAMHSRGDLHAARCDVLAEGERADLNEEQLIHLIAIIDANSVFQPGFEIGPGLQVTLPIFHQGQGAAAIGQARVELAVGRCLARRREIEVQVREAYDVWSRARSILVERKAQRELAEGAVKRIETARALGDVTRIDVVRARLATQRAHIREINAAAEQARTHARLEEAVGTRRLGPPPESTSKPEEDDSAGAPR